MREVQKVKLDGCATIFNRPNYVINSSKKKSPTGAHWHIKSNPLGKWNPQKEWFTVVAMDLLNDFNLTNQTLNHPQRDLDMARQRAF